MTQGGTITGRVNYIRPPDTNQIENPRSGRPSPTPGEVEIPITLRNLATVEIETLRRTIEELHGANAEELSQRYSLGRISQAGTEEDDIVENASDNDPLDDMPGWGDEEYD